jgi:hypothetical protein
MLKLYLICLCLAMVVACHSPTMPKYTNGKVVKMENLMYLDNRIFEHINVYVWDDLVLEQRKTREMYNVGKTDATGKIKVSSSSSQTRLSGYFLVNLSKNTYYQFNEADSLISKGQLNSKIDGIKYDWDIINQSAGNIDDFISQKDTLILDKTYLKLVRTERKDSYVNVYEVLLDNKCEENLSFRPVSAELSKKYKSIVAHYSIFDGATGIAFKGIWKIQEQLSQSEFAKVRHYQAWYHNHSSSNE